MPQPEFIKMERALGDAMCQLWPALSQRDTLRMIAMMVMGTMRLALDNWRQENAKHPLQ